jgi:UPF0755 protein
MPDPLDPTKYHMMTPKIKKMLIAGGLFFALIIAPLAVYIYSNFALTRPAQTDKEMTFVVKEGESLGTIADNLYDSGLLNSKVLFKTYVILKRLDNNIQAGVYRIPAGTSVEQLAQILQHGTNDIAVTFIEGWRAEEISLHANKSLQSIDYENFVALSIPNEGYLFPDTYYLNIEIGEKDLLDIMLNNFENKTADILTDENLQKVGLTKQQAVIFASIVEREVANEEDRPIVAGILINRWKNNELIGADATTQYAIAKIRAGCRPELSRICPSDDQAEQVQWWPKDLSMEDLNYTSPYNTRKVLGLPPTPISNPGLNSIEAVINYTQTDYNYYLTDSEGITHYAKTLEEHNQNVATYL